MYSLRPSTVTPRRAVRPAPLVCRNDALASSFEIDALPRRQRAGEAQLVAVSVVDVEVALAPRCVRG